MSLQEISETLRSMQRRLDAMDRRFDAMDSRFDGLDGSLRRIEVRLDRIETKADTGLETMAVLNEAMDRGLVAVLEKLDERAAPLEAAQRTTTRHLQRAENRRKRR